MKDLLGEKLRTEIRDLILNQFRRKTYSSLYDKFFYDEIFDCIWWEFENNMKKELLE